MQKTREQIITSMCYTWRHDYGLRKGGAEDYGTKFSAGMTDEEAKSLWKQMAQLFDNDIAPHMEIKSSNT